MILTGDGDAAFLHGLQKRRLGARAGAVDFVGHEQLCEDRPAHEAEGAAAVARLLHDLGTENVGRHQVGRELHPPRVEAEHDAERLDELRLGEAGHTDEQAVAAGDQRDERFLHHAGLAEDHGADRRAGGGDAVERHFGMAGNGAVERGGRRVHGSALAP